MTGQEGPPAVRAVDVGLAGAAASGGAGLLLLRYVSRRRPAPLQGRRLLAIDSMYRLSTLRARHAEHFVTHRDLDGYFDRVWSVHPFVGLEDADPAATATGRPVVTRLSATHTMIEGRVGRFRRLAKLPHLNFVLAQLDLVLLLDRLVHDEGVGIVRGDPYYHGLLGVLLGSLSGRAVEVRVIGNHDAIYETTGEVAYRRLFRWRAVERRVMRFTFSRADSVVVYNDDNRTFALSNGAPPERVAQATNASMVHPLHLQEPEERGSLEEDLGLGDRPIVAYVGRLERMKHPEDVILSVAEARKRYPRIGAVMVGEGTLREELAELCAAHGMEGDVVFAGIRDQAWIARLLPRCTVVAAPLAGLALVEAALSGTAIVAYDVEWHPEFLDNGSQGILVPYRDTDALADAICALVEDPARAARLGAAARARAIEFMQREKVVGNERALAERLLDRSTPLARAATGTSWRRRWHRPSSRVTCSEAPPPLESG